VEGTAKESGKNYRRTLSLERGKGINGGELHTEGKTSVGQKRKAKTGNQMTNRLGGKSERRGESVNSIAGQRKSQRNYWPGPPTKCRRARNIKMQGER